jgi:prevent-host-death family protein
MSTYSVAEAKNHLPSLIDKAIGGEQVVITRHGKPVVELRPAGQTGPRSGKAIYDWLRERRRARNRVDITSVELLRELYEDDTT